MSYVQMSHTKVVPEAWRNISEDQNNAQTAAIYAVIAKHGGDMKAVGFAPSSATLVSIINYPDEMSAKHSVAGILALGTLEFVSVEHLWDIVEWAGIVRAAANG